MSKQTKQNNTATKFTPEVAAYINDVLSYKPQKPVTDAEKKAAARVRALLAPSLSGDALALVPFFLKSALFTAASDSPRTIFAEYTAIASHPGFVIEFEGEELRQDDRMVLLALIKSRQSTILTLGTTFSPRKFCVDALGWSNSGESAQKLKDCIARLHKARARVITETGEHCYSFVSGTSFEAGNWKVWLSEQLLQMWEGMRPTLLHHSLLCCMTALDAWLYGYICADACFANISRAHLRELCGLKGYAQKEFNRRLGKSLDKLIAAKVITSFTASGDVLKIVKPLASYKDSAPAK